MEIRSRNPQTGELEDFRPYLPGKQTPENALQQQHAGLVLSLAMETAARQQLAAQNAKLTMSLATEAAERQKLATQNASILLTLARNGIL